MQRLYLHRDYHGLLRYDPNSGEFRWLVARNSFGGGIRPGDLAGTPKDGYVQIIVKVDGQREIWRAHRLAWFLMTGTHVKEIDHINGQRSDNRWDNLREATRTENNLNLVNKLREANISGVRGVTPRKNRQGVIVGWYARLLIDGKYVLLEQHPTKEEAIAARREAERRFL